VYDRFDFLIARGQQLEKVASIVASSRQLDRAATFDLSRQPILAIERNAAMWGIGNEVV
jgi:hypothetical protein